MNDAPDQPEPPSTTWDRRTCLKLLSAALPTSLGSIGLSACRSEDPSPPTAPGEEAALPSDLPVAVWKALREAVQASPDHLVRRAEEAAASKDPERIHAFVRDNFLTRPDRIRGQSIDFRDKVTWGTSGLLRSGIGTAREKAELLKKLYQEAGFQARIYSGEMDVAALGVDRLVFQRNVPEFAPDQALVPVDEWLGLLSGAVSRDEARTGPSLEGIDFEALGEESLHRQFLGALPDQPASPDLDWKRLLRQAYLVEVEVDGEKHFANPQVPGLPFGEHGVTGRPRPASEQDPMATPTVRLTLSAATTGKPDERFPLVEGSWSASDLVGRQLRVQFRPTEAPEVLLRQPLGELTAFTPTLAVQGEGLDEEFVKRTTFGGDVITVQGDFLGMEEGKPALNGRTLTAGDPAAAAKVSELHAEVVTGSWPDVRIRARVLDDQGATVPNVPEAAFRISEKAATRPFVLRANQPRPPRLLMVFDYSGSMREEFRGKGLTPLVERLFRKAKELHPDSVIQLAVISYDDTALRIFSPWIERVEEATSTIDSYNPGGLQTSNYWTALATATNRDANLVVLFTDADGTEEGSLQQRSQITEGCPAVIVGVPSKDTKPDHLVDLAAASGGQHILAEDHGAAVETVAKRLEQEQNWPYLFGYRSAGGEPGERIPVRLALAEGDVVAETSYEVPATPQAGRSFAGFYLEVEIGDRRILRTLAGRPPWKNTANPLRDQHAEDCRNALFGEFTLSFEGEAPTTAALLDTILGSQLSLEPLLRALPEGEDAILAAIEQGVLRLPPAWLALNSRVASALGEGSFTYQEGWRVILFSSVPAADGQFLDRADVLPFVRWRTVAAQPEVAWRRTLAHSLRLSLVESAVYTTSTVSLLRDRPLVAMRHSNFRNHAQQLKDEEERQAWNLAVSRHHPGKVRSSLVLLPEGPDLEAYWSLEEETGTILGHLADGSGGGATSDTERYYDRLDSGLQAFDKAMSLLGLVSPAFSVWVKLERIKVAKLKLATMLLVTMDGSITIEDFENQLRDEATGWLRDQALGQAGKYIPAIGSFNNARKWYSLATGIGGFIGP